MRVHRNCVTDPLAKQWWRDYQAICRQGNELGLSFVEYVAHRVGSLGPRTYTEGANAAPWYVAQCGHQHPWGESCNSWTASQ